MPFTNLRINEDVPFDRLTELAGVMIAAFQASDLHDDERCIAFVDGADASGVAFHGYPDAASVAADLLTITQAVFASMGRPLDIMGIDDDGIEHFPNPFYNNQTESE